MGAATDAESEQPSAAEGEQSAAAEAEQPEVVVVEPFEALNGAEQQSVLEAVDRAVKHWQIDTQLQVDADTLERLKQSCKNMTACSRKNSRTCEYLARKVAFAEHNSYGLDKALADFDAAVKTAWAELHSLRSEMKFDTQQFAARPCTSCIKSGRL